ncbi:pseudouridine synthase [Phlyctochytrium arcticum]|nr:pseudouridine synthase [Phlyctochytrium arcticum]
MTDNSKKHPHPSVSEPSLPSDSSSPIAKRSRKDTSNRTHSRDERSGKELGEDERHPMPPKKNPGNVKPRGRKTFLSHESQDLNDVEYYFEHGLRKVRPYPFLYQTYAKGRWQGMTILELFLKEFRDQTTQYYAQAIENGKIQINGQAVPPSQIIRNGDIISHAIHRHEPPVTANPPLTLVETSPTLLVINKPASVPIHPTGRYTHNCVLHILRKEFNWDAQGQLYPVNRLDRLTSGLCLVALTKERSTELMLMFQTRAVKKTYVCRVRGEFPEGEITCTEPIATVSHTLGLNQVDHEKGKPCTTVFRRLSYNGITSVVQCEPLTGRTHQIRVHLQHLGHPIANDPLYICAQRPAKAETNAELISASSNTELIESVGETQAPLPNEWTDPKCQDCQRRRRDPIPEQLCIWLHSWKLDLPSSANDEGEVTTSAVTYETPLPEWAAADFAGDQDIQDRFWAHGGLWDGVPPGKDL